MAIVLKDVRKNSNVQIKNGKVKRKVITFQLFLKIATQCSFCLTFVLTFFDFYFLFLRTYEI